MEYLPYDGGLWKSGITQTRTLIYKKGLHQRRKRLSWAQNMTTKHVFMDNNKMDLLATNGQARDKPRLCCHLVRRDYRGSFRLTTFGDRLDNNEETYIYL